MSPSTTFLQPLLIKSKQTVTATTNAMASEDQRFKIFHEELPDASMQLYSETMRNGCPITFPLFPKLPPELRLRVWRATFPDRDIKIWNFQFSAPILNRRLPRRRADEDIPRSEYVCPAASHVNLESRNEFLRQYQPFVPCNKFQKMTSYFCPATDTIVMDKRSSWVESGLVNILPQQTLDAVKSLRLSEMHWLEFNKKYIEFCDNLQHPNLPD